MNTIINGLVLAARTDSHGGQLRAFLLHHLTICERAVILVDRREHETPDEIIAVCAEFGDRAVVRDHVSTHFNNSINIPALSKAVEELAPACDVVLHIDKDEFINPRDMWKVAHVVSEIRGGHCDWARGAMICRFGVGGRADYADDLPDYETFARTAPVRSRVVGMYGFSEGKCMLNRTPHIYIHTPAANRAWRKSAHGFDLEHFRWTANSDAKTDVKATQHPPKIAGPISWRNRMVRERTPDFFAKLDKGFHPFAWSIPGFMDYGDVYRLIAKYVPAGGTFCEVGVFKGRSLCYMGEYMNLLGKQANIIGYDAFNPNWMPWGTERPMADRTTETWMLEVRAKLVQGCPVNTPVIAQALSAESAALHEDGSVDALWIDAAHDADNVCADIKAWLPKIKAGGIMAGHDYTWASVKAGISRAGIKAIAIGKTSWVAVGDQFGKLK